MSVCLFFIGHSNICNIVNPTSLLLSVNGALAFKNCTMTDDVYAFTAPEMLQGCAISTRMGIEKVSISPGTALMYSNNIHC